MPQKEKHYLPLKNKIALVTGASRGIGKGIALSLGEAGATVYITGRTLKKSDATVPLSGTLTSTAREVTRLGGKGIPCQCDHQKDTQVKKVFRRIQKEQGRLDILVNNAWAGYENLHRDEYYTGPFWEQPIKLWDAMHDVGVRSSYVASTLAAPLMVAQQSGLIVNISFYAAAQYFNSVQYGVAKMATDKMAVDMAYELKEHNVTCISLWPGWVRTEGVMRGQENSELPHSESPQFVGRAIAALASDPNVLNKTGHILIAAELAKEYGFKDTDGTVPKPLHQTNLKRYKSLKSKKWQAVRNALSLPQE